MEFNELNSSMVLKAAEGLYNDTDCVVYVNNNTQGYKLIKGDSFWNKALKKEGKLSQLFYQLFTKLDDNSTTESTEYKGFTDLDFFSRDKYTGDIEVISDGKRRRFRVNMFRISDCEAVIMLRSEEDIDEVNQIELEKIDAIHENYLFTMIVNLADDTCINPNITEVSATRQDYMDIRYSDWRLMISNMFMEGDREVFLRMSSPEYIINTLEEQQRFDLELKMMNMQGEFIWSKLTFARMKNFSRSNPKFVYTVIDYEKEMKRLLNQESIVKAVEAQNRKLQAVAKERTKFFSNASHEIRTPINAILGMNEVILRETKEENIRRYANDVKSSGRFLLSIVNDILDYSKITAGKMQIVPVEYNISDMIDEINMLTKSYLGEKHLEYKVNISDEIPKRLYGDEIRIIQVIMNLLTNAIKYTPEGSVTLEVMPGRTLSGNFALDIRVKDTGIGIKKEELSKLFGEYERLDVERNRRIEGTGLGLGIVTTLLEQMGSKLKVESVYGEGSEFSFILPQKVVKAKREETEVDTVIDFSGKRILIVDDNSINLSVASIMLDVYNMEIDTASSGKECLKLIEDAEYDLIFLDHLMPDLDGVETLQLIRQRSNIPVIAMTANAYAGARSEYMQMGFTDYIEKPLIPEQIKKVLRTYLAKM